MKHWSFLHAFSPLIQTYLVTWSDYRSLFWPGPLNYNSNQIIFLWLHIPPLLARVSIPSIFSNHSGSLLPRLISILRLHLYEEGDWRSFTNCSILRETGFLVFENSVPTSVTAYPINKRLEALGLPLYQRRYYHVPFFRTRDSQL